LDNANRAAKRLKATHTTQTAALEGVRRGLHEAGINTRNLASESRRLTRETEEHSRALERQTRIQERMAQHRGRLASINERLERNHSRRANMQGQAFGVAAAGYGLSRFFGGAGQSQSTLVDIGITADVDNEQLARLRETVARIAADTYQKRAGVLEAQQTLVAAGLDFDISRQSLRPLSLAATASKSDVRDITQSSIAILKNLNLPVEKLADALEIMAAGGKEGRFELRDAAKFMPALSAIGAQQNFQGLEGIATIIAAGQVTRDAAGSSDVGANNLQNLLIKLTSPETIANFDKFDVDLISEMKAADERGQNRLEAVLELTAEVTNGEAELVQQLFRDQQAYLAAAPLLKSYSEFQRIKGVSLASNGQLNEDFTRRVADDPTLQWTRFGESMKDFRDKIALPLLPVITDMTNAVGPMLERFGAWAAANPELIRQIGWMIGGLLTMKLGLLAVGFAATTLLTPLLWLGKGLTLARMGLTMLGLSGGGTIGVLGRLGTAFGSMTGRVAGFGWAFGKGLVADLGKVGAVMARFGGPILRGIVGGGLGIVKLGLRGVAAAMLANPVGAVVAALAATAFVLWDNWENVTGWFDAKTERVKSAFGDGFLNGMIQLVHEFNPFRILWDTLDGLVDYLFGIDLESWFSGLTSQISDMVSGLRDLLGLRDAEDERAARIAAAADRQTQIAFEQSDKGKAAKAAVDEYQALDARGLVPAGPLQVVPDYRQSLGQKANGLPTVAGMRAMLGIDGQRAEGGSVWSGGSFLVGERGPEIIQTGRSGFVVPSAATMALLASPLAAAASTPITQPPVLTLDTRPALTSAAPSLSAEAGSGGVGSVTIQGDIVIHAAPGQDEQGIAEQVRVELQKMIGTARRTDTDLHDGGELFDG